MSVTEYIGPLVGPVFADPAEWTSTRSYEALTVVLHEGNSYTARQDVPVGVQLDNEKYWLETGNYNAQIEQYRNDVSDYKTDVDNYLLILNNANATNAITIGCDPTGSKDNSTIINQWLVANPDKILFFSPGTYNIELPVYINGNSVIMAPDANLNVTAYLPTAAVQINQNFDAEWPLGYIQNQMLIINVKCNNLADTGILTSKLHMATCCFTVYSPVRIGVHTNKDIGTKRYSNAENHYRIQVLCDYDSSNNTTGLLVETNDDIFDSVVCINAKIAMDIVGGDNTINVAHSWISTAKNMADSVFMVVHQQNYYMKELICDTYRTCIKFNPDNGSVIFLTIESLNVYQNSSVDSGTVNAWDFSEVTNATIVIKTLQAITNKLVYSDDVPFNMEVNVQGWSTAKWSGNISKMPFGDWQITNRNDSLNNTLVHMQRIGSWKLMIGNTTNAPTDKRFIEYQKLGSVNTVDGKQIPIFNPSAPIANTYGYIYFSVFVRALETDAQFTYSNIITNYSSLHTI